MLHRARWRVCSLSGKLTAYKIERELGKKMFGFSKNKKITFIDESSRFVGNLEMDGDVYVEGTVCGDGFINGDVRIATKGSWQGDLLCETLSLSGEINGDVCANQLIVLSGNSLIRGNVNSPRIEIGKGGRINGVLTMQAEVRTVIKEEPNQSLEPEDLALSTV